MSALEDRRQAAREAAHDEIGDGCTLRSDAYRAIESAIETATRVRITPEIMNAFNMEAIKSYEEAGGDPDAAGLRAAFLAAGFEVES
jgi:hypothetical protein